jgi:hypothetical protein
MMILWSIPTVIMGIILACLYGYQEFEIYNKQGCTVLFDIITVLNVLMFYFFGNTSKCWLLIYGFGVISILFSFGFSLELINNMTSNTIILFDNLISISVIIIHWYTIGTMLLFATTIIINQIMIFTCKKDTDRYIVYP